MWIQIDPWDIARALSTAAENTPQIGCIISNPEQCTLVSIDMTSVCFQGFRDFGREKVNRFMKTNCCGHSLSLV